MLLVVPAFAIQLKGVVKNEQGQALPFATVKVKKANISILSNAEGLFSIDLPQGLYTLQCSHIGYETSDLSITVGDSAMQLRFILKQKIFNLPALSVQSNADQRGKEIIQMAIAQKARHAPYLKNIDCEVYSKGQLQLRSKPTKIWGGRMFNNIIDSANRQIIFLSETQAHLYVFRKQQKTVVHASRVSGESVGFGFANAPLVSFYANRIELGDINQRTYVSPLADDAFRYYQFKYRGAHIQHGVTVYKIEIIPKMAYEPLLEGYLYIEAQSKAIESASVWTTKNQQLNFFDTLKIDQQYTIQQNDITLNQQVFYIAGNILGLKFFGSFLSAYSQYQQPHLNNRFFDGIALKYTDNSANKSIAYWDSIRPLPLLAVERNDYARKDSIEQRNKIPAIRDSITRAYNAFKTRSLFYQYKHTNTTRTSTFTFPTLIPTLTQLNYNTVEGLNLHYDFHYTKRNSIKNTALTLNPMLRYGFSNNVWNASVQGKYSYGYKQTKQWNVGLGSNYFQIDRNDPINPLYNTLAVLVHNQSFIKLYRSYFFNLRHQWKTNKGLTYGLQALYENRLLTNNSMQTIAGKPTEPNTIPSIQNATMPSHNALSVAGTLRWLIGASYIEVPNRILEGGGEEAIVDVKLQIGLPILNSAVNYSKWELNLHHDLNVDRWGVLKYAVSMGGFIQNQRVYTPDYIHFSGNELGNLLGLANKPLQSFELMPYYSYSNSSPWFNAWHIEHHFNGWGSNKIPLLKQWNWFFVIGGNGLFVNGFVPYFETFAGIENILKWMRVDYVHSFTPVKGIANGMRLVVSFR